MVDIENVKSNLSKRLSEKRYKHSLGVMKAAKELAKIYNEDEKEAEFAGLIHDIAKELSQDEIKDALIKYSIIPDEIEENQMPLLHGKIGAFIAKEEFEANIKIQNAIKYHTTGKKGMDTFAKIVYLADKIEENRDYKGVEELRKLAKTNLDDAILFTLDFTTKKNIDRKRLIHPDTIILRNDLYLKKLR